MSELDEIKARAATREKYHPGPSFGFAAHDEAEADLDRAIAIAETWRDEVDWWVHAVGMTRDGVREIVKERDEARVAVLALREELRRAGDVLQTAYSAGNELGRCGVSLSPDWPKIQDQSYEEVGEFLYPDITKGGVEFYDRLAETEHYEAFR